MNIYHVSLVGVLRQRLYKMLWTQITLKRISETDNKRYRATAAERSKIVKINFIILNCQKLRA